jgi:WD40 repeat protein
VSSVRFSTDGQHIISHSTEDQTRRVWKVATGECLAVIPKTRDFPSAVSPLEYRAMPKDGLETSIESATSGEIAWWPEELEGIATHPSGRTWAGITGRSLCMFRLEGES